MRGTKAKEVRKAVAKLMELHPNIYQDRTKKVQSKDGLSFTMQRFSGKRLAKKHYLGLGEKLMSWH